MIILGQHFSIKPMHQSILTHNFNNQHVIVTETLQLNDATFDNQATTNHVTTCLLPIEFFSQMKYKTQRGFTES